MYKKLVFTIAIIFSLVAFQNSNAATATPAAKQDSAKPASKAAAKPAAKSTSKPAQTEDEKYAQVYEKCTKEAEKNEAKYDQLFNSCIEKNGFPQEEYETGGQPMQGIDGQE